MPPEQDSVYLQLQDARTDWSLGSPASCRNIDAVRSGIAVTRRTVQRGKEGVEAAAARNFLPRAEERPGRNGVQAGTTPPPSDQLAFNGHLQWTLVEPPYQVPNFTDTCPTWLVWVGLLDQPIQFPRADNGPGLELSPANVHAAPRSPLQPVAPGVHHRRQLGHGETGPPTDHRSDLGRDQDRIHPARPGAGPPPPLRAHVRPRTGDAAARPLLLIREGTFCPRFQFLPGGQLHPTVVELFQRAMELKIRHNHFTLWMITPSDSLAGSRPVALLDNGASPLLRALESLARR
jgi:hypothetical protein